MFPKFDLLYVNPKKTSPSPQLDMAMQSLLLNEVVEGISVNIILQRQIYDLLRYPEQDPANINWRLDILKDFRRNPTLMHDLEHIHSLESALDESLKIIKTSTTSTKTTNGKTSTSGKESSIFTVQTLADCIVKVLAIYEQYKKVLDRSDIKSVLFNQIRDFVNSMVANPAFEELKKIGADLTETLNLNTSYVVLAKLDEYFRMEDCEIFRLTADPYSYSPDSPPMEDKGMDVEFIGFDPEADKQLEFLSERAMIKMTNFMESIVVQLKAPFDSINEGFYFYRFAQLLEQKYDKFGLPLCLPEINTEGNVFECKDIYDLWYSIKQAKKDPANRPGDYLVPNDAIFDKDCASYIITGKNNAGKTVFLRAVGVIQVLAQAGLPVPCKSAIITPVTNIFAYFTALDIGQGRFEEEVETISGFIDIMQPNDMFLFNEVYQSTAYDEAAVALSQFIAATCVLGARVISVTHLPDMKKHMASLQEQYGFKGDIKFMKAEEKDGQATHKFIPDNE